MKITTREQWLVALSDNFIDDLLDEPSARLCNLKAPKIRVTVGCPPNKRGGKRTNSWCMERALSADEHNEIYINPLIADDSHASALALLHELIHAYLDKEDGHKNRFVAIARAVGFTQPYSTPTPSDALAHTINEYVRILGDIPAAQIDESKIKKEESRSIRCACVAPECGFIFYASRKQLSRLHDQSACPICDAVGSLQPNPEKM